MSKHCRLREHNGVAGYPCDGDRCVYWRLVGHLGIVEGEAGCAVQYFEMLDGSTEIAEWLLSVKDRIEDVHYDA